MRSDGTQERDWFMRGYLCACAALINAHGYSQEVRDVLGCTRAQAIAAGIDPNDLATFDTAGIW